MRKRYMTLEEAWAEVLDRVEHAYKVIRGEISRTRPDYRHSGYTCPNIEDLYWTRRISKRTLNLMLGAVRRKALRVRPAAAGDIENSALWRECAPERITFIKRQLALAKRKRGT